jgi:uncharacterized BrkB/YihY/UPF0761 family membrane protein
MNELIFSVYAACRKNNSISQARLSSRLLFTVDIMVALISTAIHIKKIAESNVKLQDLGISKTIFVITFVPLCFSLSYLFIPNNRKLKELISGRVPKLKMLQIFLILWLFSCLILLGPIFVFKAFT